MKKGFLQTLFIFSILMMNSISASFHYGYGFFDISIIVPFAIFAILFALIFAGLSRTFNPSIAGIVSAATAFLIYYYLFYRTGFDLQGLFFNFGISNNFFYPIFSLIFLLIAIWVILKFGFSTLLLSIGILLIALASITDIFYEKGIVLIAGIVLVVLGFLFKLRSKGVELGRYDWEKEKRQARAIGKGIGGTFRKGRETYGKFREYRDPRNRLDRAQARRQEATEKRLAREELQRQREIDRAHREALREDRRRG